MPDLSQYTEITNLHFDGEHPHIAVCHRDQGYSANQKVNALLYKANGSIPSEVVKSLEGTLPQEVVQKMLVDNKRKLLEEAIANKVKGLGETPPWIWLKDMNETMAVFDLNCELYAVDYEETDGEIIIGDAPVKVLRKDIYVDSETGEELIKSVSKLEKSNPDAETVAEEVIKEGDTLVENPEQNVDHEEIMADKNVETEEVVKASEVESIIAKAVADALTKRDAEHAEEIAKSKLTTETTELVKGFSFIEEDSVETLVKCLVENQGDLGTIVFKALDSAKEKVEALEAEIVKVKEEFGKGEAVEGEVKDKEITKDASSGKAREKQLAEIVKAKLASKNK